MNEQTALTQLLEQVTAILELRQKRPAVPGENFNVFSVMNMETKEVDTHCRLLYDFLSPSGSHGMGSCFLRAFFETALGKPYPGDSAVSVYREFVIDRNDDNYGRIDILIRGTDFCYPIEVKVRAKDQLEQVKRYAKFASGARASQVYYLTLLGTSPSDDSLGDVDASDIVCLSFAQDIRAWMKRCGEIAWNVPNVAEIIRQYIKLLNKLTGVHEGDVFMEQIEKTVGMSQANFESAMEIAKCIVPLKRKMMLDVFREIEAHMSQMKNPLEKIESSYKAEAERYYNRGNAHPHIDYRLADCDGLTVVLRFQVDWNLFFGVAFKKGNEVVPCPKDLERMENAFSSRRRKDSKPQDEWWLWWRYLPSGGIVGTEELMINFHLCNGRYTELFDPDKHKKLMGEVFDQIDQHIGMIRETGLYE